MMFSIFEKSKEKDLKFEEQLQSVPIRNKHVSIVSSDENKIVLAVELKYEGIMKPISQWMELKKEKKFELEDLAFEIYKKIDGKNTVENLIDDLKDRFQLTFFESRGLIIQYLGTLMSKGLVVAAKLEL